MFLYFTKIVANIHLSMDTAIFRKALAAMNCVYAMYLADIFAYCYFKGALAVLHLSVAVIISGDHLQ